MFKVAQAIVRHKVLVVGALVVGFVVFGQDGDEAKPSSPWGAQTAQQASASGPSMTDKAFGVVAGAAKDYAGVDIGAVAPDKLRKSTVANWENTADAARKANGN